MIVLRGCQTDLINDTAAAFGRVRRVLSRAETGFGKTVCFSEIARRAMLKGKKVLIVAHRKNICKQISKALDKLGIRHGRIMAGNSMTDDAVQVAMIGTVARRLDRVAEPDLLIIDECHHAVSKSYTLLTDKWTKCRILGVTATPQRTDGRGLGESFDEMVQAIPMSELIGLGFLAGYVYQAPPQMVDLSHLSTRMGDYAVDELADAMDKAVVTGSAVDEYAKHLAPRPAIVFCVTVDHAKHVAEQFRTAGFRAASVDGTMDDKAQEDLLASIGDGRLNVLTSCSLISEGTDIPEVAGAILLRPTKSVALFLQMVGRALRPKADGGKAVILDHVGNVHLHGLPDQAREWSLDAKKKKAVVAEVSTCKACYQVFPAGTRQAACPGQPDCLFEARAVSDREMIETVAGELVEMQAADAAAAQVIRDTPLRYLLTGHETRPELEAIRKAKGYAAGWVYRVLQERDSNKQNEEQLSATVHNYIRNDGAHFTHFDLFLRIENQNRNENYGVTEMRMHEIVDAVIAVRAHDTRQMASI